MAKHLELLPVLLSLVIAVSSRKCSFEGIGYTTPAGDIIGHAGKDSLDLYCTITNEQMLQEDPEMIRYAGFYRGNERFKSRIVNSTTIHLHINPEDTYRINDMFVCKWNNELVEKLVCNNFVRFGFPPGHVDDFKCISLNNDNLTCTWTPPNYVLPTTYTLVYTTHGDVRGCPKITNDRLNYRCFWSLQTSPQYRQSADRFTFYLTSKNDLDTYTQTLEFDHFAMVIPNAPYNLSVLASTTSSMFLSCMISPTIISLSSGLQFRVMYYCKLGMTDWRMEPIKSFKDKSTMTYNLTNIPYAYNLCDIRVSLRNNRTHDDSMWSQNATINYYTNSTLPGAGPKLHMGSYTPINETTLRIYWRKVPAQYEFGPNLRYNLTLIRGRRDARITEINANNAVVTNLLPSENYTFALWAYNDVGTNNERSYITIPAVNKRPYHVQELRKIDGANGAFTISWNRIQDTENKRIRNYTVFWCKGISDNYCSGDWNWTDVPADQTQYPFKDESLANHPNTYHVAVAANSDTFSSGMIFSTCNVNLNKIPRINLKKTSEPQAESIKLSWEVGCTDEGISNYTIDYCIVAGTQTDDCADEADRQTVVVAGNVKEFVIGGLKPYKTYVFGIVPNMKNNERGTRSSPVRGSTMEGQPTPPGNLTVLEVTNSTMRLSWSEPEVLNGVIKYYKVIYNGEESNSTGGLMYLLDNLISYKEYYVSVIACTTVCSNPSGSVSVKTLMGNPSKIEQPKALQIDGSGITIVWSPPAQPRGPLNFYEVEVDDGEAVKIHQTPDPKFVFKCDKKTPSVSVAVRAWNQDTNKNYSGAWSDKFIGSCVSGTPWLIPTLVICVILIGVPALGGLKWLYQRCQRMQDVEVKLPHTLDHPNWMMNADPIDSKPSAKPAADEELLLQTRDCISNAADSSGHSSAHGSLSETDAAISAGSDSGTEQTSTGAGGGLRKRGVAGSLSKRASIASIDTLQLNASENYSRVGANPHMEPPETVAPGYTQVPLVFPTKYMDAPPMQPAAMNPTSGYVSHQSAMGHFVSAKPTEPEPAFIPYVQVAECEPGKMEPTFESAPRQEITRTNIF